jgi:hypothetical protein
LRLVTIVFVGSHLERRQRDRFGTGGSGRRRCNRRLRGSQISHDEERENADVCDVRAAKAKRRLAAVHGVFRGGLGVCGRETAAAVRQLSSYHSCSARMEPMHAAVALHAAARFACHVRFPSRRVASAGNIRIWKLE